MKTLNIIFIIISLMISFLFSQEFFDMDVDSWCPLSGTPPEMSQEGGMYFPEEGVVRVLFIFVQFPDDSNQYANWPSGQLPVGAEGFVAPDVQNQYEDRTLSDYFHEMSYGRLHVIGDIYPNLVILPYDTTWYINHGWHQGEINRSILENLDSEIDYSIYDNWTIDRTSNNNHVNEPDGLVDMIFIIYRSIIKKLQDPKGYWGFASLGNWSHLDPPDLFTNDGVRISFSALTSGVTGQLKWKNIRDFLKMPAHELGHYLFGVFHNNVFSLMGHAEAMSSFEKMWLSYIQYNVITQSCYATLSDYVTTGVAYYIPYGNNKAFILENHQMISSYDLHGGSSVHPLQPGLYIMHQTGSHSFDQECADGRWQWEVVQSFYWPPSGTTEYILGRLYPDSESGYDEMDLIFINGHYYRKNFDYYPGTTNPRYTNECVGDNEDAFSLKFNNVFTPWSNPSSYPTDPNQGNDIGIEILNEYNGNINVRIYIGESELAAPAKVQNLRIEESPDHHPIITWYPNSEPDLQYYYVYRRIDNDSWHHIGTVDFTQNSYEDLDVQLEGDENPETFVAKYMVKAYDLDGKFSVPSDSPYVTARKSEFRITGKDGFNQIVPNKIFLSQNYPNPFNSETKISFGLPIASNIFLDIFDITGKHIRNLRKGFHDKGVYQIIWDGKDELGNVVASGIYIYILRTENGLLKNKMILLK